MKINLSSFYSAVTLLLTLGISALCFPVLSAAESARAAVSATDWRE